MGEFTLDAFLPHKQILDLDGNGLTNVKSGSRDN
jgi:hypothetical protein